MAGGVLAGRIECYLPYPCAFCSDIGSGMDSKQRSELLQYFHTQKGKTYARCIERSMQCKGRPINAHSVQNSRHLDLVSEHGHVMALRPTGGTDRPPVLRFERVGRNRATTFTGLCSVHDRQLFAPIDTKPLDVTNREQLYLLAYRALLRELHGTMTAAQRLQGGYKKRVEVGLDPNDRPGAAGMMAVRQMLIAWLTFRYRCECDDLWDAGNLDGLKHVVRELDLSPSIAASVFFSLDVTDLATDLRCMAINILPLENHRTAVVMSYLVRDEAQIEHEFAALLSETGEVFTRRLSRVLLNYAENFVVAPPHFRAWSAEKRAAIEAYALETLLESKVPDNDELLHLF